MKHLKFRLSLMNFLEFAVWGAYLTCMGNYLEDVPDLETRSPGSTPFKAS